MPFKFTSITPKGTSSRAALLEFDGVRILADPGWDAKSDITYLDSVVTTVDLILLSHPTTSYNGAYAYLAFRDLTIPTYATLPVTNLGRVATIDLYRSVGLIGPIQGSPYELNDVEEAFDKVITVKHSQTTDLRAKFDGLTITAINAGHTLGGTIWVLNKNSEKIIYAPEWNHSKDSFLNGADLLQNTNLLRPSVFITSSSIGSNLPHKKRVDKLFELVDATLGRGGTVVLPTSIGSRMLELIHLIDEHLQSAPIPVLLLSHAKARSLTYAGSMLEWMAPAVIKKWETRGQAPFDASRVQVIEPGELVNLPGAKVVFAAGAGFERNSVAQTALMGLCNDEKTTIILTERAVEGTLGHQLYETWKGSAKPVEDGTPIALEKQLEFQAIREEPLVGEELSDYERQVKARRQEREQLKKEKKTNKNEIQFEDESEDESEDEGDILGSNKKAETLIPVDQDVRGLKNRSRIFPYAPKRAKIDDYGIVISHADYTREEEKDVGKLKRKEMNKIKLGEKKKWNEGKKQDDVSDLDALFKPRSRTITDMLVNARCVLSYIDLAGLVDLRSLSLIIPTLKPRAVFLERDITDSDNFKKVSDVLKKHNRFELFELEDNEEVEADNTIQSFDILLDEELSSQLKWQKIAGGYTIAHVIGEVKTREELDKIKKETESQEKMGTDEPKKEEQETDIKTDEHVIEEGKTKEELVLVQLDQSALLSNVRAAQLAIGDVKLSELRKNLSDMEYKVEFKGEGTLVVDDVVAVRKVTDGDIVVDGEPGELFYNVRNAVRRMLAYV